MLKVYCEGCGTQQECEIEPLECDLLNVVPWGDVICKVCRLVMTTFSSEVEGKVEFIPSIRAAELRNEADDAGQGGADWICPKCHWRNPFGRPICGECGNRPILNAPLAAYPAPRCASLGDAEYAAPSLDAQRGAGYIPQSCSESKKELLMIFQAREGKIEMAIICPHCKFTNKVSVSYVEDAIHDDLSLVCVVCNELFGVVTVRKTRDAQLRIGADDAGHNGCLGEGHSGSSLTCEHPFCVAERMPPS